MASTIPFTMLDEVILHLEQELGLWNIQLEVSSDTPIELDRLRAAALATCAAHPMARAAQAVFSDRDRAYTWRIEDEVTTVDVGEADGTDAQSLLAARSRFYSTGVDLRVAPPFRLLVARGGAAGGGDLLLLNVSHVPADGIGTLRILRSVTAAYRGETLPADPVGLQASRDALSELRPASLADRGKRLLESAGKLRDVVDPPTRIAKAGADNVDAFGFVARALSSELASALVAGRPAGVSVNDRMLAALTLTIDRWNRAHGEGSRRISIMMPVNARPPEWWHEVVGMYAIWVSLSTSAADRSSPQRTVQAIAEQTRRFKGNNLAAHLTDLLEVTNLALPVGIKRRVAGLLSLFDHAFMDSAVLSNLGRLPAPLPSLVDDELPEVWFSPPCAMPLGVGVGVATVGRTIHVVTRYRRSQFDHDAATGFAQLYEEALVDVSR